jgi:hypothetical protein
MALCAGRRDAAITGILIALGIVIIEWLDWTKLRIRYPVYYYVISVKYHIQVIGPYFCDSQHR